VRHVRRHHVSVQVARPCIALIGECLIELNGTPFGTVDQTFGGDSLNTALYLARLARSRIDVQYITAVGADALSSGMVQRWQVEGIDTSFVLRDGTRLPGLYWIQVDETGERNFLYWRNDSAARRLLKHQDFERVAARVAGVDLIYLTGISLAILPEEDRAKLTDLLTKLAADGVTIVLDTNYRSALWPSEDVARTAISALAPATDLMFATFDDERELWGDETPRMTVARLHRAQARSIVVKLGAAGCLFSDGATIMPVTTSPVANVVDTTAAGDAFNAGFLSAWLAKHSVITCCSVGNALAHTVIQHRGAIIPAAATPSFDQLLAHCNFEDTPA